jgi:murein DD-endopeptidase MepM/ murein hydrolase activator NlpD
MNANAILPTRSIARLLLIAAAFMGACMRPAERGGPSPKLSDPDYLRALRLMVPVAGTKPERLSNTFYAQRGTAGIRDHMAIDIMAPKGTPVLAAVDGEILRVTTNELGGKTIYATDPGRRFVYYYAHLDRYEGRTKPGAIVKQGTVLGYVGTTGNAPKNAPHLHFQVMRMIGGKQWWEGPAVNPYGMFARAGAAE